MASSFTINLADLNKILEQIKIAERHAGNQDLSPGAVNVAGEALLSIIGPDAALLPLGLRTVSGIYNHLLPGQELAGAADQPFPRLLTPETRVGTTSGVDFSGDGVADFFGAPQNLGAVYTPTGSVVDSAPRTISNLIVDQSINNPAAVEAWFNNPLALEAFAVAHPGFTPMRPGEAITSPLTQLTITNTDLSLIQNQSPDIGLSPSFNGFMTFFGQFFDHGLDLVPKGGNGTVYIPLTPEDPLYVEGSPTNFMVVTRAQPNAINITTPFIDQNQTYTSHASHQVFLREYMADPTSGLTIATGRLLAGENHGLPTWADVKAQAVSMLGLKLSDVDVGKVPLLATDDYGRYIRGVNGFAQVVVEVTETVGTTVTKTNYLIEGVAGGLDLHNLPDPVGFVPTPGGTHTVAFVGAGTAFLDDIAHNAAPGNKIADADDVAGTSTGLQDPGTYDDELLNQHFITGDGRGNENIGLSAVHMIFHNEHDRAVEADKATILASGDLALINEWLDPNHQLTALPAPGDALVWNGERLFQAARFTTEMQYQHLVFEEFARKIQPNIDAFVFTNSADLNPAILAEFAHTVYRFGHSMLNDTVERLDNDLTLVDGTGTSQIGLIEAFLNPIAFSTNSNGVLGDMTAAGISASGIDAGVVAGAILRGVTRQVGNEIDEFVVGALRNNLVGLPLDLAAINIARGRETAIPSLNNARTELYALTGDAQLKPYTSWFDFSQNIKHPESIINFIAAYGTHELILNETTIEGKRAAAMALVFGTPQDVPENLQMGVAAHTITAPADALAFLTGTDAYAGGIAAAGTRGGLDNVDMWIGGLAEELMEFGGMLGSTFGAIFEYQLEHLQNGDRFYYLSRTQGMNLLNQLEPATFADLIMRNTDLGGDHATHLSALAFQTADHILELDPLVTQENYGSNPLALTDITAIGYNRSLLDPTWDTSTFAGQLQQIIDPKVVRVVAGINIATGASVDVNGDGIIDVNDNLLKFSGGEHVVLGGTEGRDWLIGDKGIDSLWGDGGDDYLNAGMESDQVFGGEGDDIIEDPFGDNFLRGNQGNDVISSGHGLSFLFGDQGQDFIRASTDTVEMFAGEGNDFLLGGTAADVLLGGEGNDWIEGGEGFDGIAGENSELFFNSPIIGHDVLNGQGNDTDYDGESGDDIMFLNAGITRANGMLGFDWVIKKGDPDATINPDPDPVNLGISRFNNQLALILRDRNDSVEAASGWKFDDMLIGTTNPTGGAGEGAAGAIDGPPTDSMLLSQNVALIRGLDALLALTPGAVRGQTVDPTNVNFASLPIDTTVFNPQNGGDILLGGAGSDTIFAKAGNDIIDGDRWLNVRIAVHSTVVDPNTGLYGPGDSVLFSVDSLNEISPRMLSLGVDHINPGQLEIVREIITDGAAATDRDVAVFAGARNDFTFTRNANGTVTVTDNVIAPVLAADGTRLQLMDDEGIDTLSNIEVLRFSNFDANGIPTGTFTEVFVGGATGGPTITGTGAQLTASTQGIIEENGINAGTVRYQWQQSVDGLTNWTDVGVLTTNPNLTPTNTNFYRVVVSYFDNDGFAESLTSEVTARVGTNLVNTLTGTDAPNLIIGRGAADTLSGAGGNDVVIGGAGGDTMDGGNGIDTASYADSNAAITVSLAVTTAQNTGGSGTDTLANFENLTGGTAGDTLTGDSGNNVLSGDAGADTLNGGDGNDTLDGGTGGDQMRGGAGNDVYIVNNTLTDTVDERVYDAANTTPVLNSDAGGIDTVFSSVNYTLATSTTIGANSRGSIENLTLTGNNISGTGNDLDNVLTGSGGNNALTGGGGTDTAVFTGTVFSHRITTTAAGVLTVANATDGTDTLTTIERLRFGNSLYATLVGVAAAQAISGTATGNLIFGLGGDDTISADGGDDAIVWSVGDGRDVVNGGAEGAVGDAFIVNGNNTAENFIVYSRAEALLAGLAILSPASDIVVTRNGTVIAELDEIEEIAINTGGGNDSVLVVGNFNPTDLAFNTISVNDDGSAVTVDVTQVTSSHRVAVESYGGDDQIVGQRAQDLMTGVISLANPDLIISCDGNDDLSGVSGGNGYDKVVITHGKRGMIDLVERSIEEADIVEKDDTDTQSWHEIVNTYDAEWNFTSQHGRYDNGSEWMTQVDQTVTDIWDYATSYYDEVGRATGNYVHRDDGTSYGTVVDVTGSQAYSYYVNYLNSQNQQSGIMFQMRDGSSYGTTYDAGNAYNWAWSSNFTNTTGQLVAVQTRYDDGSLTSISYDPTDAHAWSTLTDYIDAQGRQTAQSAVYDDGSSIATYFDVNDTQTWNFESFVFNAAGQQTNHYFG